MWDPVQRQETLASCCLIIIIILRSASGEQVFLPKALEPQELVRNPQCDPSPLSQTGCLAASELSTTQQSRGGRLAQGARGQRTYKPRVVRNLGPNLLQEFWPKIRQHHHYTPRDSANSGPQQDPNKQAWRHSGQEGALRGRAK